MCFCQCCHECKFDRLLSSILWWLRLLSQDSDKYLCPSTSPMPPTFANVGTHLLNKLRWGSLCACTTPCNVAQTGDFLQMGLMDGLENYLDMKVTVGLIWTILADQKTELITMSFYKQIDLIAQYAGMGAIEAMIRYCRAPTKKLVYDWHPYVARGEMSDRWGFQHSIKRGENLTENRHGIRLAYLKNVKRKQK